MQNVGIILNYQAIPAAYAVCTAVWSGVDPYWVALEIEDGNPAWTLDQSRYFVGAAIIIYCPPDGMSTGVQYS